MASSLTKRGPPTSRTGNPIKRASASAHDATGTFFTPIRYRVDRDDTKVIEVPREDIYIVFGQVFIGKPRYIYIDLETSPRFGPAYGTYETNLLEIWLNTMILCVGWQKDTDTKPHVKGWPHFSDYRKPKDRFDALRIANDRSVVEFTRDLIDPFDILIYQNGDKFDQKMLGTRFIQHQLELPRPPALTIDTYKLMKRHMLNDSNKQDDVSNQFGTPRKKKTHGLKTQIGCLCGDEREWNTLMPYCAGDIAGLKGNHERVVEPWHHWRRNRQAPIVTKGYQANLV